MHVSDGPVDLSGFGLHDSDGRLLPLTGIPASCSAAELVAVMITVVHDRPRRRRGGAVVRRTKTIEVPVPLGTGAVRTVGEFAPGVASGLAVPVSAASQARVVAALHRQLVRLELRRPPELREQPDPGRRP